jgi:hypothetical protein
MIETRRRKIRRALLERTAGGIVLEPRDLLARHPLHDILRIGVVRPASCDIAEQAPVEIEEDSPCPEVAQAAQQSFGSQYPRSEHSRVSLGFNNL